MLQPLGDTRAPPPLAAWAWPLVATLPFLWLLAHGPPVTTFAPATFVLGHTLAEIFCVVVAVLVFVAGSRALLSASEGAIVLLGTAYLAVAAFDFLHAVSYVGMPDALTPNSPHKSMYFWLLARVTAAAALLVYVALVDTLKMTPWRKRATLTAVVGFVAVAGSLGLATPQALPALFLPGKGLTALKIGSEWFIVGLHALTLLMLWRRRGAFRPICLRSLGFAVFLSMISELCFTQLGVQDMDAANALGHAYKIAAYLFLCRATFVESQLRPLEQLAQQHLREKVVLDAAPDGVLWVSSDGTITLANPAMQALSGYSPNELLGHSIDMLLPDAAVQAHMAAMRKYFEHPQARAMGARDLRIRRRDGSLQPVDISLGHWQDRGETYAIAYLRDLSERKQLEQSLQHQATHDDLTKLPNRWLFRLQVDQELARCERSGEPAAVLFLDLDYFKTVNDSYGHATGDALLIEVAQRLRTQLREGDVLARLGGDEFAVLLTGLDAPDEAATVAAKLVASIQQPFSVEDHEIHSGASVGLAFFPIDARDSTTLLRYADMAMYQAKQSGRGTYAFYSQELGTKLREDMQIYTRLKSALARQALGLHYQPQVNVRTGQVVGVEALLRWNDDHLGAVSPMRFIPVAEAMGLIVPLTEWVLDTACHQIADWHARGTPVRVAVNVSAQQLRQDTLAEKVQQALSRSGAPPALLEIEVTETAAMARPEHAQAQLSALTTLGCSVSLDDFGTGYSSLAYLKHLPVSKLKIDRKFTSGLPDSSDDVAICRAIVALAHNMGMTLVAEGVETDAQRAFLLELDCEAYQGWLFAKALPADQLVQQAFWRDFIAPDSAATLD